LTIPINHTQENTRTGYIKNPDETQALYESITGTWQLHSK